MFYKCYLQIGVGKRAEAVATVVHAVDQARIREPRETEYTEEAYSEQAALEYGYKEHALARRVVELPPEPQIPTKPVKIKEVHVPPATHIATVEKTGMAISTQVRLKFHNAVLFPMTVGHL